MNEFLVFTNLFFLVVILVWCFYKGHISDKFLNRLSFVLLGLGTTIIILSHIVPAESNVFYHTYVWQRLLFNSCFAFRCFVEFYCEYGSAKWIEAFTNTKNKLIHYTKSDF